ncbi:MAG: hypothetical protein AB8G99_12070 [Planctomycetaceae bacterium]
MLSSADNPYATSAEVDDHHQAFEVDGSTLILFGGRVRLPDRCVFTNRPTKWYQRVNELLVWSGKPGQFLLRTRSCRVRHGVCGPIRLRIMMTTLSGVLMIGSTIAALITLGRGSYFGLLVSAVVLLIGIVMAWNADAPRLRVKDWDGERFVVSGCCQEFLDELDAFGRKGPTTL